MLVRDEINNNLSLWYANGNLGKSSLLSIIEIYGLFFITDILGISAGVAGLILFVTQVWGAITYPVLGYIGDRYNTIVNTLHGYAVIGMPLTVCAFLAFFLLQPDDSPHGGLVLCILLLFYVGYTIVDVPHNSLFIRVASSPDKGAVIAGYRLFFSALGRLITTTLAAYLVDRKLEYSVVTSGFQLLAIAGGGIFVISYAACCYAMRTYNINKNSVRKNKQLSGLWRTLRAPKVTRVFLLTAINSFCLPLLVSSLVYFGKFHGEAESSGIRLVSLLAFAQMLSLLFWGKSCHYFVDQLGPAKVAYSLLVLAASVGFWFIGSSDFALIFAVIVGITACGVSLTNWSMLPAALQCVECESEQNNLSIFGLYTLINKVMGGVAQAYLGWTLASVGYKAHQSTAELVVSLQPFVFIPVILASLVALLLLKDNH